MKAARLLDLFFKAYLAGSLILLGYAVLAFSSTSLIYKEKHFYDNQERRREISKIEYVAQIRRLEGELQRMSMGKTVALIVLGTFLWQAIRTRKWPITRRGMHMGWVGAACLAPLPLAIPVLLLWSRPSVLRTLEVGFEDA